MKLTQATMQMSIGQGDARKKIEKLVFLWEEVGLCIHKNPFNVKNWNISHFNSGMSVLTKIHSLEEAKAYMKEIYDTILQDWRFTLADWESEENAQLRSEIKQIVDYMRDKINNEG